MVLTDGGKKIGIKEMSAFEKDLGVKLPEDYKDFMIESNGGMPEDDLLFDFMDEVTNQKNTSLIQEFFIVYTKDNDESDNLKNNCQELWDDQALSREMFPFGQDPAGNFLCISLKKDDYGKVYYCSHEFEDAETGYLVQSEIAISFSAFLNCLYVDEE